MNSRIHTIAQTRRLPAQGRTLDLIAFAAMCGAYLLFLTCVS